jgi:DnaJ-class molecular chaperone
MSEFKENLKKIERLLRYDQARGEYTDCKNLYDFLNINSTATKVETKSAIGEKYKFYQPKQNVDDWETVAKGFLSSQRAIEYILCDCKSEYDNHLIDLKVKDLRKHFITRTRDRELDSKEKSELIKEGEEIGLSETKIIDIIEKWLKDDGVKEVKSHSSASTSSSIPFDVLLNETYYEILGVSEDAKYDEIKNAYDIEKKKYDDTRDKRRAEARWVVVSKAWEYLRDNNKRRKYDEE